MFMLFKVTAVVACKVLTRVACSSVNRPTGLKNIGNTCYLNCMLQCLFSITPIRNAVLQFGDGKTWNEDAVAGRRDGSHVLSELEIRRALRFVRLLKDLFGKLMSQRIDNSSMSASGGGHPLAGTAAAVAPDRELADMLLLA
ncbi:ubiquitin-specific protease ubp2, partial [Linderina pennispora]